MKGNAQLAQRIEQLEIQAGDAIEQKMAAMDDEELERLAHGIDPAAAAMIATLDDATLRKLIRGEVVLRDLMVLGGKHDTSIGT